MRNVIVKQDPENELPFEVLATAIEQISKGMKAIEKTRATKKLIVALIKDDTGLNKNSITAVLDSLYLLESRYLKTAPKK